jgi:hypothetical protein
MRSDKTSGCTTANNLSWKSMCYKHVCAEGGGEVGMVLDHQRNASLLTSQAVPGDVFNTSSFKIPINATDLRSEL